ncbi:angiopoietin-related protein 1-like, partial [Ruditapes philippinarum]|uniref:angiopoietin-related protein 1-like n=1 Tax=Ruditapes philippinarum TaxID=129788 RepID=UPI00295B462B
MSNNRLTVGGYHGSCGDSMSYHNNCQFTSKDSDNDDSDRNCAQYFIGAWWYKSCCCANLNGVYPNGGYTKFSRGLIWNNCRNDKNHIRLFTYRYERYSARAIHCLLANYHVFFLSPITAPNVKVGQNTFYSEFSIFRVNDENDNYRLTVGGYEGSCTDSMWFHNGCQFTTKDSDNDARDDNCVVAYKGAWWNNARHKANLNGLYLNGAHKEYGH